MAMGKRISDQSGFTYMEVMATLVIMTIVVGSLMYASIISRHSVRMSMMHLQASEVARTYLENVKAASYAAVVSSTVPNVTLWDNGTAGTTDDIKGTVTTTVTDNGDSTKTVTVNVQWTIRAFNQNRTDQISLATMVSNL